MSLFETIIGDPAIYGGVVREAIDDIGRNTMIDIRFKIVTTPEYKRDIKPTTEFAKQIWHSFERDLSDRVSLAPAQNSDFKWHRKLLFLKTMVMVAAQRGYNHSQTDNEIKIFIARKR